MMNHLGYLEEQEQPLTAAAEEPEKVCRSVVQVRFPVRGMALTYYNDRFDLQIGDRVYVDGKLAGIVGTVTEVSRSFKIRPSDYQKVICRIDTHVDGQFTWTGRHFMTFSRSAIPFDKVLPWFVAPSTEEYVTGDEDDGFALDRLEEIGIAPAIAERGEAYFEDGHVVFLSLDRKEGRAIVRGTETYEVDFTLDRGWVRGLNCSCPCAFTCKHAYAAMRQLQQTLELLEEDHPECRDYFASIDGPALLSPARLSRGQLTLSDREDENCLAR